MEQPVTLIKEPVYPALVLAHQEYLNLLVLLPLFPYSGLRGNILH